MTVHLTLGGYRVKTRLKKGQNLLLDALWIKHGGVAEVARKLGVSVQTPANWRKYGKVPPSKIKHVAITLKESIWAFNYDHIAKLGLASKLSWKKVIEECDLGSDATEKILAAEPPKEA